MRSFWIPVLLFLTAACDRAEDGPPRSVSSVRSDPVGSDPVGSGPAPSAIPAKARPLYYERALTPADLDGRTLRELSLMRNTIYARAGNKFRKPWLHDYFSAQSWYVPRDTMDESKITKLDRENARKIADADAALAQKDLERRRDDIQARRKAGNTTKEDAIELTLLSQRLGVWVGEGDASPLEDPTELDRLLQVEELSTLSRRDLRMLRNMIYGRRGRAFESKVVQEYFKGAAWYKPDPQYDDSRLSPIDHKNIRIIMSVEESLGGPLHENPDYGKDGWFVMA
ncbi:MAG TPA: YARHG domain-containing protein [Polyangiaceae bacterium]|jgi:hypothetical protein|nr:YARHG domain-containing protein [Polyangiaceae bacterium]